MKTISGFASPLQSVTLAGLITAEEGLTVTTTVKVEPGHPFAEGVTVMLDNMGPEVLFVAVNAGILPFPLPANPIAGFEFNQVYVVPGTVLLKEITGVLTPLQNS